MEPRPDWAPPEVDIHTPSIARVYDYYLGGSHNFAADRQAARQILTMYPELRRWTYELRGFLRRAVRFCVANGVTQFLDVGSGIPTMGGVHETARSVNPDVRVVYVDIDPVAVAHTRAILRDDSNIAVFQADLRAPESILDHSETARLLDLRQPVALLMLGVLHFVDEEDDPAGVLRGYHRAIAPGSYLAITHATLDHVPMKERFTELGEENDGRVAQATPRSRAAVEALFAGFDLVEPGVVPTSQWRPDPGSARPDGPEGYGAVGRKP